MLDQPKIKVHTSSLDEHWAIKVEKVICPECNASYSHQCVASNRPFKRMNSNSVHAKRVLAAGFNIRVS